MSITPESIIDDLENDRLPLPTLPEVAIRVRETADDENASITDVAKIIETDAALSARIVQVGNSALYRGINPAETVQAAAMRMGLDTVRTLATSLVMKQLFQATHPVVDHYLRKAWKQSTDVAALSAMIAKSATTLEADSALLAGLTHCIGLSPILVKEIFEIIKTINAEGVTILLVEQNARMALGASHTGLIIENGRFVMKGKSCDLMEDKDVKEFYMGVKSEASVKGYQRWKRKKAWR